MTEEIPNVHARVRFPLPDGSEMTGTVTDNEVDDIDTGEPCVSVDGDDGLSYCTPVRKVM